MSCYHQHTSLQKAILAHARLCQEFNLVSNTKRKTSKPPRKKQPNIMRMDPTRTTLLRNKFLTETRQRFARLKKAVREFMVKHDALGLRQHKISPVIHAAPQPGQYKFLTDAKKLDAFNKWFQQQVQDDIMRPVSGSAWNPPAGSIASGPWTNKYIDSAYKKGQINAYLAAKRADSEITQTQEDFMRQAFDTPEALSKVELLATRTWENMQGVTDTMGTQLNQILSQGLIDGSGAEDIADEMGDTIDGLTDSRALVIARTELIHAHAEGQLDSFESLGVEDLGVDVEWSTAGDDRVCPECEDMEGQTFTVDEARGQIPLHPNCRCAWLPAEQKQP